MRGGMANAQAWRASAIIRITASENDRTSVCPISRLRRIWPSPAMPGEYSAIRNWRPSNSAGFPLASRIGFACSDTVRTRSTGCRIGCVLIGALSLLWSRSGLGSGFAFEGQPKKSEIAGKRLAVGGISKETPRALADRVGDESDGAIDEANVEATRVR